MTHGFYCENLSSPLNVELAGTNTSMIVDTVLDPLLFIALTFNSGLSNKSWLCDNVCSRYSTTLHFILLITSINFNPSQPLPYYIMLCIHNNTLICAKSLHKDSERGTSPASFPACSYGLLAVCLQCNGIGENLSFPTLLLPCFLPPSSLSQFCWGTAAPAPVGQSLLQSPTLTTDCTTVSSSPFLCWSLVSCCGSSSFLQSHLTRIQPGSTNQLFKVRNKQSYFHSHAYIFI